MTKNLLSKITRLSAVAGICTLMFFPFETKAQVLNEGFNDISVLFTSGWARTNNSNPLGTTGWFQGNATVFPANGGADSTYIGANFNNTTGATGTISNWLISPVRTLANGDWISFYTRTTTPGTTVYPDRLELRINAVDTTANVGSSATSEGNFTTLLLSVNPNLTTTDYPATWTLFSAQVSGLAASVSGRIALRYFVINGGPTGVNSDFIGIDDFKHEPATSGIKPLRRDNIAINVFPNPFVNEAVVKYTLDKTSSVSVSVVSVNGQTIQLLEENENQVPGTYEYKLNAPGNGIYFLKAVINGSASFEKLVVNQ